MIKIGSLDIPDLAGHNIVQTYRKLGGRSILRSKSGLAIVTRRWQKLAIAVSGRGWLPDGLDSLDEDVPVAISCVGRLATSSASNVIDIPRTFRTDDYAPAGIAVVNGDSVETGVTLSGSEATLDVVAGASLYQISYCPIVTAVITLIDRDYDQAARVWNWTLEAEEV